MRKQMKFKFAALCSACCALLCGNALGRDVEQKSSGQSFITTLREKNEAVKQLFYAVENGDLNVVKSLSKDPYFSYLMIKKDNSDRTALRIAVENGHYEIVDWILQHQYEYNFNVNSLTEDRKTLLTIATENNHKKTVEVLLKHLANPNVCNMFAAEIGKTSLMIAAEKGNFEIAKKLLEYEAKLNEQDNIGKTALMYAAKEGHADIVELLLKNKANPNKKDNYKKTAVMFATFYKHESIVKLLLEHGANPDLEDSDKETALTYAIKQGDSNIAKLLLDHGAKVNGTDKNKKTVLDYAEGNKEMTELLVKYIDRPEKQKKVNIFKRTLNKFTKKTGDPRMTMSDSNLAQYNTDKTSGLTRSQSDSKVTQYDDITEETSNLKRSESVDSNATSYNSDMQTSQDIDNVNSSTDTIAAQ